jgi:hypothetical protein
LINDDTIYVQQRAGAPGITISLFEQKGNKVDDYSGKRVCTGVGYFILFQKDFAFRVCNGIVPLVYTNDQLLVYSAWACIQASINFSGSFYNEL